MNEIQEMIRQFEAEKCHVEINKAESYVLCWLWRGDRIVGVGVDHSEIDALKRARKCLDDGSLL